MILQGFLQLRRRLLDPVAAQQVEEPLRAAARAPRVAVDESQLRAPGVDQLAPLVVDLVEEVDARRGHLMQDDAHRQQFVEIGRLAVLRLHLEDRHHDPAPLDLGERHAQGAQQRAAGRFVVADVVRMVADRHLVGMLVPDPDFTVVAYHGIFGFSLIFQDFLWFSARPPAASLARVSSLWVRSRPPLRALSTSFRRFRELQQWEHVPGAGGLPGVPLRPALPLPAGGGSPSN